MVRINIDEKLRRLHQKTYGPAIRKMLNALYEIGDKDEMQALLVCAGVSIAEAGEIAQAAVSCEAKGYLDIFRKAQSGDPDEIDKSILTGPVEYLVDLMAQEAALRCRWYGKYDAQIDVVKDMLLRVFDYDAFRDGKTVEFKDGQGLVWHSHVAHKSQWGGYQFIKGLNVSICPYCGADTVYAFEIKEVSKTPVRKKLSLRYVPHKSALDHYYSHEEYPYLGMSLYNLVPCCFRCNSQLKNQSQMIWQYHAHPYVDSVHDVLRFHVSRVDCDKIRSKDGDDDYEMNLIPRYLGGKRAESNRAMHLMQDVFQTDAIYHDLFANDVRNVLYKLATITENSEDWYAKLLKMDRHLLWGFDLDANRILENRFGKLTIDLVDEWPSVVAM